MTLLFCYSCHILVDEDEHDPYTFVDSVFIYKVDLETGEIDKITEGENPLFIPNSNKIVYRYYDKIFTINLDKTEKKQIAIAKGLDIHAIYRMAVSNQGDFLIFASKVDGIYNLFKADLDGRKIENLTESDKNWEYDPVLSSADNFIIYYDKDYSENTNGYSYIDIYGNNYKKLIYNQFGYYSVFLLPDDLHLAVFNKGQNGFYLYYVNINTFSLIDTLYFDGIDFSGIPVISKDLKLFYSANAENLYTYDLNTKQTELIYSGFVGVNYIFSGDFKKVLFGYDELYLVDIETNKIDTLFTYYDGRILNFQFSFDSKGVVFVTSYHNEF
jgi:hypothetical protein